MAEKGVVMALKADLKCPSCYKKIKEILCKLPQVRGQVFDVKQNTVTITVVCCCSPEKFREKLCCKGRKVIKSIEIKGPQKTNDPKEDDRKKNSETQRQQSSVKGSPEHDNQRKRTCCEQCAQGYGGGPCFSGEVRTCCEQCAHGHGGGPCFSGEVRTCCEQCAQGYGGGPCFSGEVRTCCEQCAHSHGGGPCFSGEVRTCCEQCAHGHGGGPCFYGYGHGPPPPPPPCYSDSCYYAYGYVCGRCHHVKCVCFIEENPPSCAII